MSASQLFSGSGNPNSVVIGSPGDLYQDQTGGLWVNETAPSTWTELGPTSTFAHQLTVANGGTPDFTSIKDAVNAAILAGASASNPYNILVSAGTYNEDPFTVPAGVFVSSETIFPNAVIINANNTTVDLIGLAGGVLVGVTLQGVTGPGAALVRCTSTPTLWNCRFRKCTIGVAASGASTLVGMINCGIILTGLNQTVGTGILLQGGASGALSNFVALVPAALAALYAPNDPISVTISVQAGSLNMAGALLAVAGNTGSQTLLLADSGGNCELSAVAFQVSRRAIVVGSVGTGTRVDCIGCSMRGNAVNVTIQSATGLVLFGSVALDTDTRNIVPGGELTGTILLTVAGSNTVAGDQFLEFAPGGERLDVPDYYHYLSSTGLHNGGVVSETGGLGVSAATGAGIIQDPIDESVHNVSWPATALALTDNATNYIFYDDAVNAVIAGPAPPGAAGILLATVVTLSGAVLFNHNTSWTGETAWQSWVDYLLAVRKIRVANGLITTQGSTARNLNISNGLWYRAMTALTYLGGTDVTWTYFYGPNGVSNVPGLTLLDITNYDNGGVLTPMTAGFFRQDVVVITSDDRISVLYGATQWPTSAAAQAASATPEPSFMSETGATLAHVIVQQGLGIDTIIDVRPLDGTGGSGSVTGVTSHSALSNLLADDHPQYLRTDGSRIMTGDLQGGGNDAVNFGTYNGVAVEAHAIRHAPGGADALAIATPVAISVGAVPSDGVAASYVRSDHQHGIPAGVSPSTIAIGDAAQEGVSGSVARADHVHALPDPAAPVNVTKAVASAGIATTAARADHKHDVATATPVAIIVGASPSEGASTALARADHQHGIAGVTGVLAMAYSISRPGADGTSRGTIAQNAANALPTSQLGHIRVMDVSFPAGWVGGAVTINGTAPNGTALSEVYTKPPGGGLASGTKAFLLLTGFVNSAPAGPAGVLATIQTSPLMGVPQTPVLAFLKVSVDGSADTFTFTNLTNGTFNTASPHTGNHTIELWYTISPFV